MVWKSFCKDGWSGGIFHLDRGERMSDYKLGGYESFKNELDIENISYGFYTVIIKPAIEDIGLDRTILTQQESGPQEEKQMPRRIKETLGTYKK